MDRIQTMIYLSPGNLPSQMAHTGQIAKMAQAFAQRVAGFELVTGGDWRTFRTGADAEFWQWYSLHQPFRLVRLPIHRRCQLPFPEGYRNWNYYKLATLYAYYKSPRLIYTRTGTIARYLLSMGVPVMWEWHEFLHEGYHDIVQSPHLLGLVTIAPQLAESYIKEGVDPNKICVASSATDLDSFLPNQSKLAARTKLGLPGGKPLILYSGHLQDYKGIPTLLEVAERLPHYQFILVGGWATDVKRVQSIAQSRRLTNVQLIGHVPQSDLPTYLYAADVLLLPTSQTWQLANTTSPLKLFDYMAVKKPIVASALPTIQTILRDRHNALLAQPDDPLSFQEAITTLIDHPSIAQTLANQAYQDVQQYTWEKRADRILQFAVDRLAQHSTPSVPLPKRLVRSFRTLTTQYP
ncbi:glycosyltransferase [Egbenema bharatensis]|uniref:glycosyltransferase n=1 Tax=Egbenema bharatensis TaxID=3463334 RepID=UPI003A8A216D